MSSWRATFIRISSATANALRDWSYADAKSKYETAGAQSQAAVQAAIDKHQRRKA